MKTRAVAAARTVQISSDTLKNTKSAPSATEKAIKYIGDLKITALNRYQNLPSSFYSSILTCIEANGSNTGDID